MIALQIVPKRKQIELVEVDIPKITKPDDVLIRVAYSGFCGTDLHIIEGKYPIREYPPLILGHEFSGTVADLGQGVDNFEVGDEVAADPNNSCKCCEYCHEGKPHFCTGTNKNIGTFQDGGFAEYIIVPAHMVHKLPDGVTLREGALAEPLSCISHGIEVVEPLSVGSKILITGAGIIGTLWACVLHLRGHRHVTVCDPVLDRLEVIRKLDLDFKCVTPEQLQKGTEESKQTYNLVIDCSGNAPIVEYGISRLQRGGKYCCFGVSSPEAEIKINPFKIFYDELTILGVKINPYSFSKALGLVEAMRDRYLDYQTLGIKIFKLDEHEDALRDLKHGKVLKAMFVL